jgi:hypothetical protein
LCCTTSIPPNGRASSFICSALCGQRLVIREPLAEAPRLPGQLALLWRAWGLEEVRSDVTRSRIMGPRYDAELRKP